MPISLEGFSMKRLFCLVLVATFAALAADFAGTTAPVRKPRDEQDPPKDFTNSIGMKFVWIPSRPTTSGVPD
jgi:hypothetical protein